jgi:hypothetical protein
MQSHHEEWKLLLRGSGVKYYTTLDLAGFLQQVVSLVASEKHIL